MRRRFATLDVFTARRFAGNPLAVVLEAQGLDTAERFPEAFHLEQGNHAFHPRRPMCFPAAIATPQPASGLDVFDISQLQFDKSQYESVLAPR